MIQNTLVDVKAYSPSKQGFLGQSFWAAQSKDIYWIKCLRLSSKELVRLLAWKWEFWAWKSDGRF